MLAAAAQLIAERGFSDTRIADVAARVGASPALVIYYFGTKDSLLTEALRFSERAFYVNVESLLAADHLADSAARHPRDVGAARQGRGARGLGTLVRPLGAGVPPPGGEEGPRRARRAVARPDRPRGAGRASTRARSTRSTSPTSPRSGPRCSTGSSCRWRSTTPSSTARAPVPSRSTSRAASSACRCRTASCCLSNRQLSRPGARRLAVEPPRVGGSTLKSWRFDRQPVRRSARWAKFADEPVDVLVGVLHRHQPLLDLAPRRQEGAAVVLHQPVGVAVAAVEGEEVTEVVHLVGQERDAALRSGRDHPPRQPVLVDHALQPGLHARAQVLDVGVRRVA